MVALMAAIGAVTATAAAIYPAAPAGADTVSNSCGPHECWRRYFRDQSSLLSPGWLDFALSHPVSWRGVCMDPTSDTYDASDELEYTLNWFAWILRGVYPPPAYPSN
jgi:hypothetical protein